MQIAKNDIQMEHKKADLEGSSEQIYCIKGMDSSLSIVGLFFSSSSLPWMFLLASLDLKRPKTIYTVHGHVSMHINFNHLVNMIDTNHLHNNNNINSRLIYIII